MKICKDCLSDFLGSSGAQSKDGRALIGIALARGFSFEVVPPRECKDSSHKKVIEEKKEVPR